MLEGRAHDRSALGRRSRGERPGEIVVGHAPMRAIKQEKQKAHRVADGPDKPVRQCTDDRLTAANEEIFEPAPHDRRPRSQATKSADGSIVAVRGTIAIGRSPRASVGNRTASFAVVSTMAAAAFLASRSI